MIIKNLEYSNDYKKVIRPTIAAKTYEILETAEVIEQKAFENSQIEEIDLKNVNVIADYAFSGSSLKRITSNQDILLSEGTFYNCNLEEVNLITCLVPSNCFYNSKIDKLTLKETKAIGSTSFANCTINELNLPDTLETIDVAAFMNCKFGFTKLILPPSVQFINRDVFKDTNITDICLPDSIRNIGNLNETDITLHVSKELFEKIKPELKNFNCNVVVKTLEDILDENKSFREVNELLKENSHERN